jgi:Ca-activated chloride channel family protein
MGDIAFLHPQFFWLLLLLPALVLWHYFRPGEVTLKIPSLQGFKGSQSLTARLKPALFVMRLLALCALIVALARPRTLDVNTRTITTEGIDIVIAMDVSASMLSLDLKPNRMEALKKVATEFVDDRPDDRIGVVVYAGESYTRTPVTSDHEIVKQAIKSTVYDNAVLKDGTDIGIGLATAVNRLKDSKTKSRVIILLTDGVNNTGSITPEMASDIAYQYDIKIYTIGVGTEGFAEQPTGETFNGEFVFKNMPVKIDEALMKDIARKTGGKYFRATDNNSLKAIYDEINKLEKSEIKDKRYLNYNELFRPFLLFALALILIEFALRKTVYRSII